MCRIIREKGNPLKLVHGFDAADAFDFRYGKGTAAFAIHAEVAAGRGMQRIQDQMIVGQGLGDSANFRFRSVVKVATRGKDFQGLETCAVNLRQQFAIQLFGNEEIGREDPLHKVRV